MFTILEGLKHSETRMHVWFILSNIQYNRCQRIIIWRERERRSSPVPCLPPSTKTKHSEASFAKPKNRERQRQRQRQREDGARGSTSLEKTGRLHPPGFMYTWLLILFLCPNFLSKTLRALFLLVVRMNALICDLRSIKDNNTAISISVVSTNSERFLLLLPCKDGLIHVVWMYSLHTLKPLIYHLPLALNHFCTLKFNIWYFLNPKHGPGAYDLRFTMLLIIAGETFLSKCNLQQTLFRWLVFFCHCG